MTTRQPCGWGLGLRLGLLFSDFVNLNVVLSTRRKQRGQEWCEK
jgi:hypothetical protein